MIKLCMTRFELPEDLGVIKTELFGESDSENDNNNNNDDCDLDFRYISNKDIKDLTEDIDDDDDDDYDDNKIDDNNINRAREPCSPNSDNF
jgi:hypothetical protein